MNIQKFLQFNGKNIYYLDIEGTYWIALKPICEALEISWKNQHEKISNKEDVFNELSRVQGIVAADKKLRKMVCLPEQYIYGWIFSIQLSNTMSQQTRLNMKFYKKKCCDILYNHFHGTIIKRKQLLNFIEENQKIIIKNEKQLLNNELYRITIDLKIENKKFQKLLKIIDNKIKQPNETLF